MKKLIIFALLFSESAWSAKYSVIFDSNESSQAFLQNKKTQTNITVTTSLKDLPVVFIESNSSLSELISKKISGVVTIENEKIYKSPPKLISPKLTSNINLKSNSFFENMNLPEGLNIIQAPKAWQNSTGQGSRVLIIDSGLDANHPALSGKIIKAYNFMTSTAGLDAVSDDIGHGTHVAGIIAGKNLGSFSGVAPDAKLLVAKVCDLKGCSSEEIAQALAWGLEEKVDAINLSLGGAGTVTEKFVIDRLDSAQITVVAAVGNDGAADIPYPAAYNSVLAVGSVNLNRTKSTFSNWGPQLDIMAPGSAILSSVPQGSGRTSNFQYKIGVGNNLKTADSISFLTTPLIKDFTSDKILYVKFGKKEDYTNLELINSVVVVDRGEISNREKILIAESFNVKALIILNNDLPLIGGPVFSDEHMIKMPVVMVDKMNSDLIRNEINNNGKLAFSFSILSSDYSIMSGTSMSAPFVTGVVALMKPLDPYLGSYRVRKIISQTSSPVLNADPKLNLPGIVDADAALKKVLQ